MPKLRRDGGSEHRNLEEMVALNAKTEKDNSERRNWE